MSATAQNIATLAANPPTRPPIRGKWPGWRTFVAAAIVAGAVVRVVVYARGYSFWTDEAWLAINVASRSFRGLARPLDYDQSAPLLFLWAQKLTISAFGTTEFALRALSLLAGVLTLPLLYWAGVPLVGRPAAAIAVVLAAISPTLVDFSNQDKQYAIEALTAVALVLVAARWVERGGRGRLRALLWIGALATWLSATAVFVLVGVTAGLAVAYVADRDRDRDDVRWFVYRAVPLWGSSFAAAYAVTYRHAATSPYLQRFWKPLFLVPGTSDFWGRAGFALDSVLWGVLVGREPNPTTLSDERRLIAWVSAIVLTGIVAGVVRLARQRRTAAVALLCGPLLLAIAASLAGRYPPVLRTMLFGAPFLFLLAAAGLVQLWSSSARGAIACGVMVSAAVVVPPAVLMARDLTTPLPREHLRPLLDVLRRQPPGDVVYVSADALPAYTFYTTDWSAPNTARLAWLRMIGRAGGPAFQNGPPRGRLVVNEGDSLVRRDGRGLELFGISSGVATNAYTIVSSRPDSGWAANEARRIRAAVGRSDGWLLMPHLFRPERALLDELRRGGNRVEQTFYQYGSALIRIRHG